MRKFVTYLIAVAAVLLLLIVFVIFRDDITDDTLGFVTQLFNRKSESSEAGSIPFDEGQDVLLALCEGRLVALSPDRLVLYDKSGNEMLSRTVSYDSPALTVAGGKVVAYDRVGSAALAADIGGTVSAPGVRAEYDFPVLTASGNTRGQYVLVTNESGYRGVARIYDKKGKPTYEWYSGERYIMAVSLSPSGKRMAVAAVGQQGETVGLRVTFLDTGRNEPLATVDITDELALAAFFPDNNHVCILTESGVYFYTDDGLPLGHYSFGGRMLLKAPIATDEALFLNLGRNAGGQYSQLICLSYTGTELGRVSFTEGPDGIAAAGRYCAILEAGVLTRFTLNGTELNSEELGECSARNLLVDTDGSILLLYSNYGEWYNAPAASAS